MTLLTEKGTFTKTTSTTTPVSQQVNLTNSSLTPKLLILWTNGQTTTDGSYAENIQWSFGWSDGTNHASQAMMAQDNITSQADSYIWNNNAIISIISTGQVQVSRATVTAFAAGSFTLSWTTQSDTSAISIHYMVIGGTDITNVSVVTTTAGDNLTGNHSYNGSGTVFTPDVALIMTGSSNVINTNTLSNTASSMMLCIGAAKDTTHRWAMAGRTEAAATSDTNQRLDNNICILNLDPAAGAGNWKADFVSFNSAAGGGITINTTNAPGNSARNIGFLLIKGGLWDVNSVQQRSGTGTQDVSFVDSTIDPALVFLGGINSATANASQANNYLCLGGADDTRQGNSWCGDQAAQANMVNTRSNSNTKVYRQATPAITASSSTTNAEASMNVMNATGKFQLNWTTADTTLRQIGYWMVGAVVSGNNITKSLTETIAITDSATRLAQKGRLAGSLFTYITG